MEHMKDLDNLLGGWVGRSSTLGGMEYRGRSSGEERAKGNNEKLKT